MRGDDFASSPTIKSRSGVRCLGRDIAEEIVILLSSVLKSRFAVHYRRMALIRGPVRGRVIDGECWTSALKAARSARDRH